MGEEQVEGPDGQAVDVDDVIERMLPALSRLARSYVGADLQEDLTQEIVLSVWQSLDRFRGDSSLRTYVYRVAHNRAVDFVRKSARRPDAEELEDVASDAPGTERVVRARRARDRLVDAIRTLPLDYRQPLVMALEGMAHRDIAEVLDISTSNVGVRVHRARKRLETEMEEHE